MKLSFNDFAKPALVAGQMILSGWAGAAAADEASGKINLGFPAESEGYSRATDTAVTMTCRPNGNGAVCTIDAFGNLPMLHTQQEITLQTGGLSATGDANLGWGTRNFRYDFSPIKDRAASPKDTGTYKALADGVQICDIVPIPAAPMDVGICVLFNKGDGVVQMKLGLTGELGEVSGPYQGRPFDFTTDTSHMNRLSGKVPGGATP